MLQGMMKMNKFFSSPVPALEPNPALKKKNVQFPLLNNFSSYLCTREVFEVIPNFYLLITSNLYLQERLL